MKLFNFKNKIIGPIFFVIIFLSTSPVKSLDKFDKADRLSDYFSGILLLNDNQYEESLEYFKKLRGLEAKHLNYSIKYLYSLVNSGNFKEAFNYSKKLEKQKKGNFESHLITGIFHLKNSNFDLAQKYFLKAKKKNSRFFLNNFVISSLYNWSKLSNLDQSTLELKKLDDRFENLKKIQNVFLNCYFNSPNTNNLFSEITSNQKTDFSRYNYFYASYRASTGKRDEAKNIVNVALKNYPRNLLLNQYIIDLKKDKNILLFNCEKKEHVIAEILYITANALSTQSIYPLSNFYLNLAKYLNEAFFSYDTLMAENFYKTKNFHKAKKIYNKLSKNGEAFNWYSSKQLAKILLKELGPRLDLELVKVEEGACEGRVLFHQYVEKTIEEVKTQEELRAQKEQLKIKRRKEQEENVKRKEREKERKERETPKKRPRRLREKKKDDEEDDDDWPEEPEKEYKEGDVYEGDEKKKKKKKTSGKKKSG